jgi:hypothetical protein
MTYVIEQNPTARVAATTTTTKKKKKKHQHTKTPTNYTRTDNTRLDYNPVVHKSNSCWRCPVRLKTWSQDPIPTYKHIERESDGPWHQMPCDSVRALHKGELCEVYPQVT